VQSFTHTVVIISLLVNETFTPYTDDRYLQLSILIGQIWTSSGYFCSFIGHDRTAEILQSQQISSTTHTCYLSFQFQICRCHIHRVAMPKLMNLWLTV